MAYLNIGGRGFYSIKGITYNGKYAYSYYNVSFKDNLDTSLAYAYTDANERSIYQDNLFRQKVGLNGSTVSDNNSVIELKTYEAKSFSIEQISETALIAMANTAASTEASFAKLNKLVELRSSYLTHQGLIDLNTKITAEKGILLSKAISGDISGVLWPGSFNATYNPIHKYGTMNGIVVNLT